MKVDIENDIKLDILHSLARSQRAIARMMESIADVTTVSPQTAMHVTKNMESMNKYQRVLGDIMLGIRIKKVRRSMKGKLWINENAKINAR